MKPTFALAGLLLFITYAVAQTAVPSPSPGAAAGTYDLDPAHSSIGFVATHLGISHIAGRFNETAGGFTLGDQPSFHAVIQVKSVDTGVKQRDDHLRSNNFFKVEEFPTIEFKSRSVQVENTTYHVVGDFTMHGQTKEITLPLRFLGTAEFHGERAGFAGEITIDRREWGLDAWSGLVGNDIKLVVSFEGIKQ